MVVDGLGPLIKMLGSESPAVKEAASLALANLTTANTNNCQYVPAASVHTLVLLILDKIVGVNIPHSMLAPILRFILF